MQFTSLPCSLFLNFEVLNIEEKVSTSPFFQHPHQIGLEGFRVILRHFTNGSSSWGEEACLFHLIDVSGLNTFPLEVLSHSGFKQHLDQFALKISKEKILPSAIINLGMRSMFQSLFYPYLGLWVSFLSNWFQHAVKFKDAPSSP